MTSAPSAFCLPPSSLPADWLPLEQAAPLIGLSLRTLQRNARQWAKDGRAQLRPPREAPGKPVWWVRRDVHAKLTRYPDRNTRSGRLRESLLAKHPANQVTRAYKKHHWLMEWRKRCAGNVHPSAFNLHPSSASPTDRAHALAVVAQAKEVEGADFKISLRSLQHWWRAVNQLGDHGQILGVAALIDNYAPRAPGGLSTSARSAQAIDFFYSLYRTQNRRSVQTCHAATLRESRRQGWSWAESYAATARWLRDQDDLSLSCLAREGPTRWAHRYLPHSEQDWSLVEPGEFYVADHTQCDFWILHEGRRIRPWFTAVQDCRSRCIVGWHLGPTPHSDAIAASLRMAFVDWAIPRVMRFDNGKDFTSEYLTGVTKRKARQLRREWGPKWKELIRRNRTLVERDQRWLGLTGELGIELIFATPYAAWSKGTVERFFGTMHDQHDKDYVTYCGNSTSTRPECVEVLKAGRTGHKLKGLELIDTSDVPTMDSARVHIAEWLERYHAAPHRGVGVQGTPLATWQSASTLRKADIDALLFLMQVRGSHKVGPNGVSFTIGGGRITYGASHPALKGWAGRNVLVAVDPASIGHCFALDPHSRQLIARLEANQRLHPLADTDQAREAIAKIKREQSVIHKAARLAPQRTRTMAQRINADHAAALIEARATGTDHAAAANIEPVSTGFEAASSALRSAVDPPLKNAYDDLDIAALDFSSVLGDEQVNDPYADIDIDELEFAPELHHGG